MKNSHSESYAAAGVDVTAGYEAVERIKPMVESTYIPGVMEMCIRDRRLAFKISRASSV